MIPTGQGEKSGCRKWLTKEVTSQYKQNQGGERRPGRVLMSTISWLFGTHQSGLPWWSSGEESAWQCRGLGFDPCPGKMPHAKKKLSPCATTTEPAFWSLWDATTDALEPRDRDLQQENPPQWETCTQLESRLCAPRLEKSSHTAMTQHSQRELTFF